MSSKLSNSTTVRPRGKACTRASMVARVVALRVLVDGVDLLDGFVGQQLGEAGIQVGDIRPVERPRGTEINNAVDRQRPALVGKLAALQRAQQSAHHGGLADAAPPDYGHQSQRFVLEKLADLPVSQSDGPETR